MKNKSLTEQTGRGAKRGSLKHATPVRRKRMSAEERRSQILEAAQRVFIRSGLGGSRTKEIAQEAGVNEATLFTHFESKDALFDAAIVEPMERMVAGEIETAESYKRAETAEAQRQVNIDSHARLLATLRDIYPLFVTALFSDAERGRRFYNDHLYPWFRTLAPTLRTTFAGKRRKNLDPEAVAMVGVGAYFALVMDHNFRDREIDEEKLIRVVSTLFESGLYED